MSKITNKKLIEILSHMDEDMPIMVKDKDSDIMPLVVAVEYDDGNKYQIELCVNEFVGY